MNDSKRLDDLLDELTVLMERYEFPIGPFSTLGLELIVYEKGAKVDAAKIFVWDGEKMSETTVLMEVSKEKQAKGRRFFVLNAPKAAYTKDEIRDIKRQFAAQGITLIVSCYNNNTTCPPEFREYADEK